MAEDDMTAVLVPYIHRGSLPSLMFRGTPLLSPSAVMTAVLLPLLSFAQVTFERHYGGESAEWGFCVQQTADSGYIVAGTTLSFGAGFYDGWLVRTDARGETLWTCACGGTTGDYFYGVENATGGGFLVVGNTGSFGAGGTDVWLVRTDFHGDSLWTKTYGGTGWDGATSLRPTADSGYVIAGHTSSLGAGEYDGWLLKVDASGETLWTKTYGGTGTDRTYSVAVTSDGGFILTGFYDLSGPLGGDLWLVRTDSMGDTVWTRTLPAPGHDAGYWVEETEDGGYIVVGATSSFGAGNYDLWLLRFDARGDTLWTKTYGGSDWDEGKSVKQGADGGFVVAGHMQPPRPDRGKAWLLRTDTEGETLWTRAYGGQSTSWAESMVLTSDGSFAMAGMTQGDVYLVKTDGDGLLAVGEHASMVARETNPATLVRGMLMVPRDMTEIRPGISDRVPRVTLLDAIGRKLLDLVPGPNDVWHLATGVYFLKPVSGDRAATRKLVLER
jgi:hypothetical protein